MGTLSQIKIAVVAVGLTASMAQAGQGTFTTWERVFWVSTGTNPPLLKEERAVDCAFPGEWLDSEADPEGNWGFPNEGLQLSLRFEKLEFHVGEPMVASVIVRNVHNTQRMSGTSNPDTTEFIVTDEMGRRLPRKDLAAPDAPFAERLRGTSPRAFGGPLQAATQLKYKLILSDTFDLTTPGSYEVRAIKNVRKLDDSGFGQVTSGTSKLRVVASKAKGGPGSEGASSSASNSAQASHIVATVTGQLGRPAELAGSTGAPSQATYPTSNLPGNERQSNSSPSTSESDGTQLGFASATLRIGASVVFLFLTATLVYILLRRARRT